VHEDQGVEIEMGLDKVNMPTIMMVGLLQQIQYDLMRDQTIIQPKPETTKYDA
jgi:hypothetical protein